MDEPYKRNLVPSNKLREAAAIGFGLALAVLLVGGGLGTTNARRLNDNRRWVAHTHEVIGELEALLSTLKDAETGQRGYLLTEDEKYLQPYDAALGRVQAEIAHLKELTSDNSERQARLAVLARKIDVRLNELKQTIALMKNGERPAALKIVRGGTGKAHMDDLRQDIAAMQRAEHDLLRQRAEQSEASYRTTLLSVLLTTTIGVVLVGLTFYLSRRHATLRQQAAEVLAEQGERLRTTLASIGDAVIATDTECRITNMNAVAESLTGWKNAAAMGQPLDAVFRIVNEKTRQTVENPVTRALRDGIIVGLANHTVLVARDGTERPIDDSAAPIRCKEGAVVGCVLVFRDISERRRSEKKQREAQERVVRTLESVSDGFFALDREWKFTYVNQAAARLVGRTAGDLIGKDYWEEFPAVAGSSFERVYRQTMTEGVAHALVDYYPDHARWYEVNSYPSPDGIIIFFRNVTEQKEAEQAIARLAAESERERRLFETVLATTADCNYTFDLDGRFAYANKALLTLWGKDQREVIGKNFLELDYPRELADRLQRQIRQAIDTRQPVRDETPYTSASQGERQYEYIFVPVLGAGGAVEAVAGSTRDVTERTQAAEQLREGRERLRMALSAARMVAWQFDPSTGKVVVSENAAEVFGLAPGATLEHVNQGFGLVHPDDVERHRAAVLKAVAECASYQSQFRMVRSDNGVVIWLEERGHAVREGPGQSVRLLGVVMDVTKRKQAEEQFRVMAENIPQLAWMARPDGHIFWYNRRWYEYTGTTPEAQEGWGWESVHDPEVLPKVLEQWRQSLATGEPFDMVFPLKGWDGVFRPFLTRVMPVKDAEGRVVQWFGTNTDVTEQRRTAEALQTLTAELSEADRRKDEFLATLAHELRNPLAPIRNGLQIMRLAGGNGAVVDQARTMMERQLGQMVHLVDDLLDVSRISRGKLELRKERVSLAVVLNNAVETSRPLIESSGHELTVAVPPGPVFVEADVTRLGQVFANLLNNAAKYSEEGGRIWLTAERQGSDVVVSVKDAGVGIPPEMLPKIFDMFTQVDRSLERSQGGLGIGLTLVKRLVEMHGGNVEARSEGHGRGSEFVVRLPVALSAVRGVQTPTEAGAPAGPSGPCRILIADDNEDSATSLAMMLKIMGNEVRTANDGLQAVDTAARFRPDVILLDIGMPKLNGYEACRRIRAQPGGEKVVLIALTGWGQEEDRRRSQEVGFNQHMVKPVDPAALEKLLASLKTATA